MNYFLTFQGDIMIKRFVLILALALSPRFAFAQDKGEPLKDQVDGLSSTVDEMKTIVDALNKIKITGYIQTQYQFGDSAAQTGTRSFEIGRFAGGAFGANVNSRFAVRRGRLKVAYDNNLSKYVLQFDVTQGGVGIKDAYVEVTEPWLKTFALTVGAFDRPFGYEISYSSGAREAPERSRMFQTLFPGERELGAKLTITPQNGLLSHFNLKAGVFNGVLNTAGENDNKKDIIGRLGFTLPFREQNFAIDGGISIYSGNVTNLAHNLFSFDKSTGTYIADSTSNHTAANDSLKAIKRQYVGFDVEMYYDVPVIGGAQLRAEYITGDQPGTASTSSTANFFYGNSAVSAATPVYKRKFSGYYVTYVQSIGLKNQLVLKYDVFKPNKDLKDGKITNSGIATARQVGVADLRFKTVGFGLVHHWNTNVKFTFYYEKVYNQKANGNSTGNLNVFTKDVKDNVFTARVQYSF